MYQVDELLNDVMRDLNRMSIGFEPTLRRLQVTQGLSNQNNYPPFNLEIIDDHNYRITLAVAGFGMDDLDITVADNKLSISGEIEDKDDTRRYTHKGIAGRSFSKTFVLADHVNVIGAVLENGLLMIDLKQEIPEALKPRKIAINGNGYIESTPLPAADE